MWEFFRALLPVLGLQDRIEIRDAGGITDIPAYVSLLKTINGFDAVVSLGLVRDCETDPVAAFQDICSALQGAALPVPPAVLLATAPPPLPKVTVMLIPDAGTPGMLETLLWRSLTSDPRLPCVEQFLDCIRQQTKQPLAHEEKSRIHAYIAGREQPWLLLGQAARANFFPWASPAFDEVKGFVRSLLPPTP
jgi:hypothetical protein